MHIPLRLVQQAPVIEIARHGIDGCLRTAAETARHGQDEGVEGEDFGRALDRGDEVRVGDGVGAAVEHGEGVDRERVFGAGGEGVREDPRV